MEDYKTLWFRSLADRLDEVVVLGVEVRAKLLLFPKKTKEKERGCVRG
jgi:hypothetical protein